MTLVDSEADGWLEQKAYIVYEPKRLEVKLIPRH